MYIMLGKEIQFKVLIRTFLIVVFLASCKSEVEQDKSADYIPAREFDTTTVLLKFNNTLFTFL